jgi:hypothetical protein
MGGLGFVEDRGTPRSPESRPQNTGGACTRGVTKVTGSLRRRLASADCLGGLTKVSWLPATQGLGLPA